MKIGGGGVKEDDDGGNLKMLALEVNSAMRWNRTPDDNILCFSVDHEVNLTQFYASIHDIYVSGRIPTVLEVIEN